MGKPKHYIPILTALLLLCGLGFASNSSTDQQTSALARLVPERGRVTFSEGKVEVRRQGGDWEALYTADRVNPDDSLRTDENGRVEVSWGHPRRVLRVERASVVGLRGGARGNRLVLVGANVSSGAIWARVIGQGRPFALSSSVVRADTRAGSREATFSLRAQEASSRLAVYRGDVLVGGEVVAGGSGVVHSEAGFAVFDVSTDDDLRDGWRDVVREVRDEAPRSASQPGEAKQLTKDLRDLNPEIYLGVEVELTGRASDGDFEADGARIRKIKVRSEKWDNLLPDNKVRLLNDTFYVLKERYPTIMETVVLEFDDERPTLSLKYAAAG